MSRILGTAVRQNAHVLGPLRPSGSLAATLATRLPGDGPTKAVVEQLLAGLTGPHLRAITALPDLPHPALSRAHSGHPGQVQSFVVAPDGSWLASTSDQEVRIWDPISGTARHTLTGHTSGVSALGAIPDGSWLASADTGGELRIWDPITGAALTSLRVAGGLFHLVATLTTIAAAGERGLYFLALCRDSQPGCRDLRRVE